MVGEIGKGIQRRKWQVGDNEEFSSTTNVTKISFAIGLGYNIEHFFIGGVYAYDLTAYKIRTLEIASSVLGARFFIGTRF